MGGSSLCSFNISLQWRLIIIWIRTIFDIDVETAFEEKPWKFPGADISDFFNFGLDEEKWKDFCKQLVTPFLTFGSAYSLFTIYKQSIKQEFFYRQDQLRLESTMKSRIRVYESGRSEQVNYDPIMENNILLYL